MELFKSNLPSLYLSGIPQELEGSDLDTANLKAYYRFNTGDLTTDNSGNSHTLTAISDPAEVDGIFGKAVDFDGNDAYSAADHADFRPTGSFTVSAWIKTTTTSANYFFQSYSTSDASKKAGWIVGTTAAGLFQFYVGRNTGAVQGTDFTYINSNKAVNDGVWHLLTAVYDGSKIYVYIDGYLDNSTNWTYGCGYSATNYVRVGCFNGAGTNANFFTGSLDEVAIWNNSALSASGIQTMYGKLSAYYRFSSGALATDSAHWNTLTAISDPAEDTSGVFGGAVALDGGDAYSLTDNASLKPTGIFSVGGWFKSSTTGVNQLILSSYSKNPNIAGFQLYASAANKAYFLIGNNTSPSGGAYMVGSTKEICDGNWHNVIGTWDGTYIKMYVDGIQEGGDVSGGNAVYATTNYVRVGCYSNAGSDAGFSTGSIDDLFIWNGKALTAEEVWHLYEDAQGGFLLNFM